MLRILGYIAAVYLVLTIVVGVLATPGIFVYVLLIALALVLHAIWVGMRWAFAAIRRRLGQATNVPDPPWRPILWHLGVALVLIATAWAGGLVIVLRQQLASGSGWATRHTRATYASRPPPPAPHDLELAREYEPQFIFSRGEQWFPSAVETYLRSAVVKRGSETVARSPSRASLAGSCAAGCHLTIGCDDFGDEDCVTDRAGPGVVYARVLRADGDERERRIFDRPLPFADLETIVEYWVYYRYNDWVAWWGGFREWHEADWEAVVVGLSATKPLFGAYASHCGGEWRAWSDLGGTALRRDLAGRWVPEDSPGRGPHPLAFVAEGGHAAYPDNLYRSPDFTSCPPGAGVRTALALAGPTFASGVRETMEQVDGRTDLVRVPDVELIDDETDFIRFDGRWAPESVTRLPIKTARAGGPQSPRHQDLWIDPIWTIFCKPHWSPGDRCPAGLTRLPPG